MTRVIFLNRYFAPDNSATSQIASDLAFDLAARGFHVIVITGRQRYNDPGVRLPVIESINGVRVERVWSTAFGRRWLPGRMIDYLTFYLSATWALLTRITAHSRVVAMTDPPLISAPAAFVAKYRHALLVNWLQDVFPEVAERLNMMRQGWLLRILTSLRNWSLRKASANVVIGQRTAMLLKNKCDESSVQVIPNWAIQEGKADNGHRLRRNWMLENHFVIGYSGNMGRVHALDSLIEAASRLRNATNITFLFIGDGAQLPTLRARAQSQQLTNVLFKPYQPLEVLLDSLSLPDVHVVSLDERLEGLIVPSKFVGILAVGKPVLFLGAADGEIGSCIARSGCGVVAATADVDAIVAAIERLAGDPAALAAMAAGAHDLWDKEFRRRRALDQWAQLLSDLHD
ncbi:MAG: glycosyltransferase family 4 protein [Nitrospira sp.]